MRTFTDMKGDEWCLNVTTATLLNIRSEVGLDLLSSPGDLPSDLAVFVDVLHVALRKDCKQKRLNAEEFAERMEPEVLPEAIELFVEELVDFFTRFDPAKGEALRRLWEASGIVQTEANEVMARILGVLSTVLLEQQASIQED